MRRLLLRILVPLMLLMFASPAWAQGDDQRARELYENGALLYEEGDYENAVIAWKQAYDISERPLLLYNIANALERIGEWQEAFDYLNQYRAFAKADERDTLDRRMRSIERRLEDKRSDEEAVAEEARTAEEARAAEETSAGTENTSGGNTLSTTSTTRAGAAGPNPGGVILLGAGLGGVAVGGIFGGLAVNARADAASLCSSGDPVLCPDTAREALDNDRNFALASDISMIAGGAVAAAGLVVLIVDATSKKKKATSFRILPSAGPEGGSVTLVAR